MKFFFGLLVLWLFTSGLTLWVDHNLRNVNTGLYNEWKTITEGNINADVLFIGSSRAKKHFNPGVFDSITNLKSYNLGIDGSKTMMQYAAWKTYLNSNIAPGHIIISIEPDNFGEDTKLYNKEQYLPFYTEETLRKYIKQTTYSSLESIFPIYKYHGYPSEFWYGIVNAYPEGLNKSVRGFESLPITDFKYTVGENERNIKEYDIQSGIEFLNYFLTDCKTLESKLTLVYTPHYHDDLKSKYSNLEDFINAIELFSVQNSVEFLDFRGDSISLNQNLFYDAAHLNFRGARKFTEMFAQEFKNNL